MIRTIGYILLLIVSISCQNLFASEKIEDLDQKVSSKVNNKIIKRQAYKSKVYVEIMPKSFEDKMILMLPNDNQIIIKDKVLIKGKNEMLTDVYIDQKKLRLSGEGMFLYDKKIDQYGPQFISLVFFTDKDEFFVLKRRIIRLKEPVNINQYTDKRKEYIYFYNSKFLHQSRQESPLDQHVSRADLAYFVKTYTRKKKNKNIIIDAQGHWAEDAIKTVVEKKWMNTFPDGNFKPDDPITKIEYLMTLANVLDLPLDQSIKPMNIKDVPNGHWFLKYIKVGYTKGYIKKTTYFKPKEKVTFAQFIDLVTKWPEYQKIMDEQIEELKSREIAQGIINKEQILSLINQRKQEQEKIKHFFIKYPRSQQIVFKDKLKVEGIVKPVKEIKINESLIYPDMKGHFEVKVPLIKGLNVITLNTKGQTITREVMYIDTYQDLESHWIKTTAAKLKYLKLLENTTKFEPNKKINRRLFAQIIAKSYQMVPDEKTVTMNDINIKDEAYENIKIIVNKNILLLDEENNFSPNKLLTRSEALMAIMSLMGMSIDDHIESTQSLPFWDIKKNDQIRGALKKALNKNIISASTHFYPNKVINKAELVALMSKTTKIKNQLSHFFLNQAKSE